MKITDYLSPNFSEKTNPFDMVIIHYTDLLTCQDALNILTDPEKKVSAHYVIEKNGHVYRLVPEDRVAHHAGVSFWDGRTGINNYSIGIELDNKGHQFGPEPFPDIQIRTLIELLEDIRTRNPIRNDYIIAHSDIAPNRKQDPGVLFPWKTLADEDPGPYGALPLAEVQEFLKMIGYDVSNPDDLKPIIIAFQRHFMPSHMTGELDARTVRHIEKIALLFQST